MAGGEGQAIIIGLRDHLCLARVDDDHPHYPIDGGAVSRAGKDLVAGLAPAGAVAGINEALASLSRELADVLRAQPLPAR